MEHNARCGESKSLRGRDLMMTTDVHGPASFPFWELPTTFVTSVLDFSGASKFSNS